MAISVGILNLVLREYEGALALYPLVSDCIRNVKIRIMNLSVQKGHAGLVKKFHVDKVGSITSRNCTDFLPFYQKSKQKSAVKWSVTLVVVVCKI